MLNRSLLFAALFFLVAGCAGMRKEGIGPGDFLGLSSGSREHWSAALDRPARNVVALSLASSALALQINGADRHWQREIARHGYGPGNSPGTGSDIGQLVLPGAALVSPLLFAPHPELGVPKLDYVATGAYALGANLAINQIVKVAVGRTRPDGSSFSFYSGHTTAAFTGAQLLYRMYGWKAGVPAYAAASLVGLYRVEASKHFPSDVLVGAAMGIWITDLIYEKNHGDAGLFTSAHRTALVPIVSRERTGLALSWSW